MKHGLCGSGDRRALVSMLAIILLAIILFASQRAAGFVIVPFELEAQVTTPEDGEVIYVPRSAPFADVRVAGFSRLTYFATNDAEPLPVTHSGFLMVDGVRILQHATEIVPPFAFTDLFGLGFAYAQTYRLGVGGHVAQVMHEIFTPDSVIRGIAVDTHVFSIVPVDMPLPASGSLLAIALAMLARRRREG